MDMAQIIASVEDAIEIVEKETYRTIANGLREALVMLKKQDAVKPTWSQGKAYCGKCSQRLPRKRADKEINYCGYCGKAVKWE